MSGFTVADIARYFLVPIWLLEGGHRPERRRATAPSHPFTGSRHRGTRKHARRYAHRGTA